VLFALASKRVKQAWNQITPQLLASGVV